MLKKLLKIIFYTFTVLFLGIILLLASLIRTDISVDKLKESFTDETSVFLDIDGMDVHVKDEGEGQAVMLIHGTFASLHTWEDWTSALTDSFRVVRIDLPGFGLTGPQPQNDYSARATLHLLEEVRNQLGIDSWVIAGNSLGARFAAEYARHFPEQTDGVVFIGGAGGIGTPSASVQQTIADTSQTARQTTAAPQQRQSLLWRALGNPVFRNMLGVMTPRFAFSYTLKEVYGQPERIQPEVVDRYYRMLRREGNRQSFLIRNNGPTGDRSHIPELPSGHFLPELDLPVLIMWGEQDRWISVQAGRRLHQLIEHSELIIYEDAGHVPMEEIPDRTVADFRRFLFSIGDGD